MIWNTDLKTYRAPRTHWREILEAAGGTVLGLIAWLALMGVAWMILPLIKM